jgi:ribonuclease-3
VDLVHRRALGPDRRRALTRPTLSDATRIYLRQLTGGELGDEDVWVEAVTHGSTGEKRDYERLEFLGDRVLGLAIAHWLYVHDNQAEGKLAQRLAALVSRGTCADIARACGLADHIRLGKQARDDGGTDSDNILGDVMESVIGAAFVTGDFARANAMVERLWADTLSGKTGRSKHPKSALQEWAAGNAKRPPRYSVVDTSGPDHSRSFTVRVEVQGVGSVEATANSKQDAETQAARKFIETHG